MRQIVPHASATLHQLHLLFVDAHNRTVRIGIAVQSDHETVAQRCHLMIVSDARHRTSGRYNVSEMV